MKPLKVLSFSTPIAVGAIYWFHLNAKNMPIISSSVLQAEESEEKMKLEQVQVIFRHGARTPISWSAKRFHDFSNVTSHEWDKNKLLVNLPEMDINYTVKLHDGSSPSAPKQDELHGSEMEGGCITGQLTYVGKKQLYDLGKWLSDEYVVNERLISPSYHKDEIYVRSSYFQRTIQSVVCLWAGLYEKGTIAEPICIETKEIKDDMYPNHQACTNFTKWFKYVFSHESHTSEEDHAENYINNLMGKLENKENAYLTRVNDLIRCRRAHGLSVPQFLLDNEELISKHEMVSMNKLFGRGDVKIIRNCIGSFLDTVCCCVTEGINGPNGPRMFLYSAHDWTILSILVAFGVDVDEWPSFASHLIIELYKGERDECFVRVRYNGKSIIIDRDSGQDYLPAEKFLNLMQVFRVVDFDKDCGNV